MIGETAHKSTVFDSPFLKNVREQVANNIIDKHEGQDLSDADRIPEGGQSGTPVSDWWPHVRGCVDDIAVVRSMYTTDNNHGAQMEFLTGRHLLDGCYPTIGAGFTTGSGPSSDDLPQFISMGPALESQCMGAVDANYLGPENSGVLLKVDPDDPLPFARPGRPGRAGPRRRSRPTCWAGLTGSRPWSIPTTPSCAPESSRTSSPSACRRPSPRSCALTTRTNPRDGCTAGPRRHPAVRTAAPGGPAAHRARGPLHPGLPWRGRRRRLGCPLPALRANHSALCAQVDRPIAGLLTDLKRRGLLDETIVVWATEFGRTPAHKGPTAAITTITASRSGWPAAESRGESSTVPTDELGFHAVEHRHYVTDIHATVLQLLGLDSRRLEIPGSKRLEVEHGKPMGKSSRETANRVPHADGERVNLSQSLQNLIEILRRHVPAS